MKKFFKIYLILSIAATIIILSCKKWAIDYRNKFVGEYTFTYTTSTWNGFKFEINVHQIEGKIYYQPLKSFRKTITIELGAERKFQSKIDRSGNLTGVCPESNNGSISSESISITGYYPACDKTGNKEPVTSYTLTGTKK